MSQKPATLREPPEGWERQEGYIKEARRKNPDLQDAFFYESNQFLMKIYHPPAFPNCESDALVSLWIRGVDEDNQQRYINIVLKKAETEDELEWLIGRVARTTTSLKLVLELA